MLLYSMMSTAVLNPYIDECIHVSCVSHSKPTGGHALQVRSTEIRSYSKCPTVAGKTTGRASTH